MIDFLIMCSISVVCYVTFVSSLRRAHENRKAFEDFIEKGRQRKIDLLYGRDVSDQD